MALLEAQDLTLAYDAVSIVDELSLQLPKGEVTIIVGANGCGKSTLLRGLARLLKPAGGKVLLDGQDIHTRPAREVAKMLGLLPQTPTAPDGITVRELVGRGRYPHQGWFKRWNAEDEAAVERAMKLTGTTDLAERPIDELSGGQRQRVWIAMALAQETELLLLDEPTTYLDVAHQLEVLDVISELNRTRGTTVVIVLHDLNLAARYADHLVALKHGKIVAAGHPATVVTEDLVKNVFGMPCRVIPDPVAGTPLVLPIGRHRVLRAESVLAARGIYRTQPPEVEPAPGSGAPSTVRAEAAEEAVEATAASTGDPAEGAGAPAPGPGDSPMPGAPPLRRAEEISEMLAFATRVVDVASVGKNFKRVTFAGADLAHFGAGDAPLDLRIKLMIPPTPTHGAGVLENATGAELPDEFSSLRPGALLAEDEASGWYRRWLALPEGERGSMRTYTARALRPAGHRDNRGGEPEIDIDFVLHLRTEGGRLTGGPATVWAAQAQLGDELLILGPNAALCDANYGGIEFRPGTATRILLAGDETAAPAICSILESLPAGITGHALIEVPTTEDIQGSSTRSGVSVQWLPRGSHPHGELLASAVRSTVAIPAAGAVVTGADPEDVDVDETILWETATASTQPFYAWLAGEAGMIKELRRYLVRDAGMDRKQVAFMGYWRRGKSEG
ncbi:SIP domain-containing protein [Paeniglutamicibacter kerguelensis]|uniref:Mycobactin import ATP-binding/permease protein IrtA n=1 Tax=Paeniglutamicibacter kerguelensis TaxID=254788 RepID=A0ABS4XFU1_9MICC|nr:SIP domain-containing protein [Paeniglutamicibacter kerguelensis]MBP2387330.1 iron complex transport system ATP-binding protein [Paeniglutamicibacter kerguelensis]